MLLNLVEVTLLFDQLWQLGLPESGDAGGGQRLQPVLCIVCQASTALCRSIRRRVIGSGDRGGTQLKVRTSTHWACTVAIAGLK